MDKEEILEIIKELKKDGETTLDLWKADISSLPKELFEFTELTYLDLADNNLSEISIEVGKLKNLQVLNLKGNRIKSLPKEIGELVKLESLDLSENKIAELPPELFGLKELIYLSLHKNKLKDISSNIGKLKSLRELDLSGNELDNLPLEISLLPYLSRQELNIDGNNIPSDSLYYTHSLAGVYQLFQKVQREKTSVIVYRLANELRAAFKTYLVFFDEYVKEAKGKFIDFVVKSHDEGLELRLEVGEDSSFEEINIYFQEYLNFLKEKNIQIEEKIEVSKLVKEIEFLKLQLEVQKNTFQQQVNIEVTKIKMLTSDNEFLQNAVLTALSSKPQIIQRQQQKALATSLSTSQVLNIQQIKNDFNSFSDEITKLNSEASILIEEDITEIRNMLDDLRNVQTTGIEVFQNQNWKTRLNTFFRKSLNVIKESKAILIDAPNVVIKLKAILSSLLAFAIGLGENFSNSIESIKKIIQFLSQIT